MRDLTADHRRGQVTALDERFDGLGETPSRRAAWNFDISCTWLSRLVS